MEERRDAPKTYRRRQSPEEIEREHRRMSLEMSRRQVAHDLESARSDVHRTALEHALHHLDDELGKL